MTQPITDPRFAGERLLTFAREGRLIQNVWHTTIDGREFACHLGAAAAIIHPGDCPSSLMPAWMAHSLIGLFDGQTNAHAMSFARRWGEAMIRPEWKDIKWDTVRNEWLAFIFQQAKDAAKEAAVHAQQAAAFATTSALCTITSFADSAAFDAADAMKLVTFENQYHVAWAAEYSATAFGSSHVVALCATYSKNFTGAAYDKPDRQQRAGQAVARDAQADALMDAIEKAMEVTRE